MKRVIVTGATGVIGRRLGHVLIQRGYAPVIFSRDPGRAREQVPGMADYVAWQPAEDGVWATAVEDAYGIVHLGGAPVFERRWTPGFKQVIRTSRVIGTRGLVRAVVKARRKPVAFVSASAIGYYGFRDDTPLDETAPPGTDFLAQVCQAWEAEVRPVEYVGVRPVLLRIGVTLDPRAGPFPLLAWPVRLGLGSVFLPGSQWVSWVHVDDVVGAILLALADDRVQGPLNVTAPDARTHRDFMLTLGHVLHRPIWARIPGSVLRVLLGEFAATVTTGQRVVPARLTALGYPFQHPHLEPALRHLLHT